MPTRIDVGYWSITNVAHPFVDVRCCEPRGSRYRVRTPPTYEDTPQSGLSLSLGTDAGT